MGIKYTSADLLISGMIVIYFIIFIEIAWIIKHFYILWLKVFKTKQSFIIVYEINGDVCI